MLTEREMAAELFRRMAGKPAPGVRHHPAYDSLTEFSRLIYRLYDHAPHLAMIDQHLMQVTRYVETRGAEGIGRLIITMPPRHGKTMKVSRIYPAWHLGRNPHNRVMMVSYGQGLANKNSRAARNWIRTAAYRAVFPRTRLAPDSANVMEWDIAGTDGEGGASALGAGGGATGKGAHCFPAGTLIRTEIGNMGIEKLCAMPNPPRVAGYDHREGCVVWCDIEASRVIQSEELIEITTQQGRSVVATADHPVYVIGSGYVEAGALRHGDKLIAIKEDLPGMRREKRPSQRTMSSMLRSGAASIYRNDLCKLRKDIFAATLSARKSDCAELCGCVLFPGVFGCSSCGEKCQIVRNMRQSDAGQAEEQILFGGMPGTGTTTTRDAYLPTVPEWVCAEKLAAAVLFAEMCKRGALGTNDRGWEFALSERFELCDVVYFDETADYGTRSISVCGVWDSESSQQNTMEGKGRRANKFDYSSYQRESAGQYEWEPDYIVQNVSCDSPQIGTDTVGMVRRICGDAQPVYDLQVAGCHNFFANEILVHNCLIIDDPIKSREQAESETYREKIWNAYTDDLRTRLEPGGAIVIMHTRWHEDDLVGRIQARGRKEFVELNLPAIAEENDALGRSVGEALWSERYPIHSLLAIRDDLGSYSWNALYQQRPHPAEGGILKRAWFDRVRVVPEVDRKVRYWDLAMSSKQTADYTVGLRMERGIDGNLYITDMARGQKELSDLPAFIKDVMMHDGPEVVQGFEKAGYMTRAVQNLAKDPQLARWTIKEYVPDKDKLTRVIPAAARAQLGVIKIKEGNYVESLLSEFSSFPNGVNDDIVDAFAGAYDMVSEQSNKIVATGKRYA